jgi:hypothetical protein
MRWLPIDYGPLQTKKKRLLQAFKQLAHDRGSNFHVCTESTAEFACVKLTRRVRIGAKISSPLIRSTLVLSG